MAGDSLYDRMRKRVVVIEVKTTVGETINQSGIIMDCKRNFAYIITDPRQVTTGEVTIVFPDDQRLNPLPEHFLVRNGVVGILCYGSFDADLVQKIEIYNQPLVMSQKVCVFEGVFKMLTEGKITLFSGDHFSHNCAVPYLAEYGAPVVTKNGELVGICDSGEYHLDAKNIFSLLDTITSIKSDLGI